MLRRQNGRSAAIHSQALTSIWHFFLACLAVSLNRFLWPPRVLTPCVSCAKSTCRGRRFPNILIQWPVERMLILPERQMTHITHNLMLHVFDVVALSRMTKTDILTKLP